MLSAGCYNTCRRGYDFKLRLVSDLGIKNWRSFLLCRETPPALFNVLYCKYFQCIATFFPLMM